MDQKKLSADIARFWINENAVIIDTETTGLDDTAEIVEIAIIDCQGKTLLDSFVKPRKAEISPEAYAVHGISEGAIENAPSFRDLSFHIARVCAETPVVMYNSAFDMRLMNQSAAAHGIVLPTLSTACAMKAYARFYGMHDPKRKGWKWQSLENAAAQQGITIEGRAHSALTDCRTTLKVIQAMAAYQPEVA